MLQLDDRLVRDVKRHEGYRPKAYQDSVGVWTIGYGTNLQELVIDEALAGRWLVEKLVSSRAQAETFPWYAALNQPRKNVVVEMIYNLGPTRFAGFKAMLAALAARDEHAFDDGPGMAVFHGLARFFKGA